MRISDWSSDVCSSDLRSEPMSDEDGRPVFSQEALEMRDKLVEQLCALPVVGSALDHIIGHFGTDAVAEVTGRSRRIVIDAHGRQRIESRSPRTNLAETDAFMRNEKKILIFSDAGGTGRSYHASLTRSEEHTSELQSLMRISYAVFCLKKKTQKQKRSNKK